MSYLFDDAKGLFFLTNTQGVIVYSNASMKEKTGFDRLLAVGKKPKQLWGGNMSAEFYQQMWYCIRDQKKPFMNRVKNVYLGKEMDDDLCIAPVMNQDQDIQFYISIKPAHQICASTFKREFYDVFQDRTKSHDVIFALKHWIQSKDDIQISNDIAHFLQKQFVFPLQEELKERVYDADLVMKAKQSPQEFHLLYQKYHSDIYEYFLSRICQTDIAQEFTQDVFLSAYRHLPQYSLTNATYKTYLLRIAHNIFVSYLRKQNQGKEVALHEHIIDHTNQSRFQTLDVFFIQKRLRKSTKLTKSQKFILEMKYIDGYSVKKIARVLNKTENAIKLQLSRARKKLTHDEIE